MYRKYLLNTFRKKYQKDNNIKYDYIVRTRFDFGTLNSNLKFIFNQDNTPIMCDDCLEIGDDEFINEVSEVTFSFPMTPKVIFDENFKIRENKMNQYKNWKGDKFWDKQWVFIS